MTVVEVRQQIAEMEKLAHDPEAQASIKYSLYLRVLTFVAAGPGDDARLAKEALQAEAVSVKWSARA